ncbi:MAG: protein translocase subunit SecF [Candidatus Portnoybacteria bacterium]|nr:protein translocase subunit SecF [Candidatus Portnoybacteria bacterium]
MLVIKYRKIFYAFSALLVAASFTAFWYFGFDFSIEFTGGSLLEIEYSKNISSISQIEKSLTSEKLKGLGIQQTGDKRFLLRFGEVDEAGHQKILSALLGAKELRFETIGPIIGEELRKKTIIGLLLAVVGMFLYVGIAFRKVSRGIRSWRMSFAAILALVHDVVITGGGFVILSHYYGFEVGTLFVAAELTIWGYSINDTIVVFDRIRENLIREGKKSPAEISGQSISQTIGRSINTSGAVLILLLVLLFMGPSPLLPFVAPLIIGVIIGTYSSIFLATPLLLERA